MKTDLIYQDDILYVNVEGTLNKRDVHTLQKKMYSVISAYGIQDIVIDIKCVSRVDEGAFYGMLDDYDHKYGGNLKVTEK